MVAQVSGISVEPPELSTPASIAGVDNAAPMAVSFEHHRRRLVHGGGRGSPATNARPPGWASRVRGTTGGVLSSCAKRSLAPLLGIAQRRSLELDAMRAVHDAVEDRVGDRRIGQPCMPGVD